MTDYIFTGAYPRVLAGLSQGVNASLTPSTGDVPPRGATIEAFPGDAVYTDEPYEHPELTEVVPEPQPTEPDGTPIPVPAADPAHDTMTAEGAPAPAEPTA